MYSLKNNITSFYIQANGGETLQCKLLKLKPDKNFSFSGGWDKRISL